MKTNKKQGYRYKPWDEEENSEAAENTPSFQKFDDQPFDEEQTPDATHKWKSALYSEKPKRPNWQGVERREQN